MTMNDVPRPLPEIPDHLFFAATSAFDELHERIMEAAPDNDSLISGRLGLVLYYYTVYEVFERESDRQKGADLLELVFKHINAEESNLLNPSFSKGLCGFLYTINYLTQKGLLSFDIEEEFKELDAYLCHQSVYMIEQHFNDYMHGGFGTLLYYLERLPAPYIEAHAHTVLNAALSRAVESEDEFWLRNFLTSVEEKKEINLSLAHGQPSFLLILLQCFDKGLSPERLAEVVRKGLHLILKSRQDVDYSQKQYSLFPMHIKEQSGHPVFGNRLAWCYGDLNQVLLLYRAGHSLQEPSLTELAHMLGDMTIGRTTPEETASWDAHFCHGASGLAQFYRVLYLESGLPIYQEAYFTWFAKTLELLPNDLSAGRYKGKETALLDGLPAIALTLLSGISGKELTWSKFFLL